MPMGGEMKKHRLKSGKVKAEQIKETGAEVVLAPCHNCVDQIRDLSEEYDLGIKAIHFKEAIVKTMDIPDEVIPFVGGGRFVGEGLRQGPWDQIHHHWPVRNQ